MERIAVAVGGFSERKMVFEVERVSTLAPVPSTRVIRSPSSSSAPKYSPAMRLDATPYASSTEARLLAMRSHVSRRQDPGR
jgi:hypothetical protein